jgi:hypothetical protein
MRNIKVNISVGFSETEEPVTENDSVEKMDDGSFRLILDYQDEFNIDRLENALLQTSYPALRSALSEHLEQASKKKACQEFELAGTGRRIEEHPSPYQVDGEIGRFTFKTYDVKGENKKTLFAGTELFPTRKGRQWYPTSGFKEVALIYGTAQRSYRQTIKVFNHGRRQEVGGTPLNTLCDVTQTEGLKVLDFLARKTESILKKQGFNSEGVPEADCTVIKQIPDASYHEQKILQPALTGVCEDMAKKGLSAEDIEKVQQTIVVNKAYEKAGQCVYVHIDDVGVKEQKQHRDKKGGGEVPDINQKEATKGQRPTVQNTVARIEYTGKGFTLTGRNIAEVLRFVLAFLLNNGLLGLNIKVCTDGKRDLQDAIVSFFSWHRHLSLLLDWFHLVKKFKEDLSLACKGREIRNRHLKQLLTLLWFGLVDKAQAYLAAIPATDIKETKAIARLSAYLDRNRKWIPCYAMRSKLKLPNSSNPVERCNNLVTAKRQKHHGMSWSENGSYALTSLSAVTVNNATQQWVENRTILFVLVARAA